MCETEKIECPEPLRGMFLELLRGTLLWIRHFADDQRFCFVMADQAHNIPGLIADFKVELLRYYWGIERPCCLHALERINRQPPATLIEAWNAIEPEYLRLCGAPEK